MSEALFHFDHLTAAVKMEIYWFINTFVNIVHADAFLLLIFAVHFHMMIVDVGLVLFSCVYLFGLQAALGKTSVNPGMRKPLDVHIQKQNTVNSHGN